MHTFKTRYLWILGLAAIENLAAADQFGNTFGAGSAGLQSGGFDPRGVSSGNAGSGLESAINAVGDFKVMQFYVGGGVGANMNKTPFTATTGTTTATTSQKSTFTKTQPAFSLVAGVQQKEPILTDFSIMMLMAPGTLDKKISKVGGGFFKNSLKESYRFGISGAIGAPLPMNPALALMGKVGLVYSGFDISYKDEVTGITGKEKKKAFGVAPGILLKYDVSDAVSAYLDISCAFYKAVKTKNLSTKPNSVYNLKFTPRITSVLAGATMKFGGQ